MPTVHRGSARIGDGMNVRGSRQAEQGLGFKPLYRQVREVLVRRIADGVWQAGQLLPSEPEIAADLGVSPGTVRKALDEMTAENLVVRRQGRGTYVARHDDARILFQFFKLVPDDGHREFPESRVLRVWEGPDPAAAAVLDLPPAEPILRLERVRLLGGQECVFERIALRAASFQGLATREVPNNLYEVYATDFGVTIGRAHEKLKAVAADPYEAEHLGVVTGCPLLRVDRTAYSLDERPAEWRVSLCRTDAVHYSSDLR